MRNIWSEAARAHAPSSNARRCPRDDGGFKNECFEAPRACSVKAETDTMLFDVISAISCEKGMWRNKKRATVEYDTELLLWSDSKKKFP